MILVANKKRNTKKKFAISSYFSVRVKTFWYLWVAKSSRELVTGINLGAVKNEMRVPEYALSSTNAIKQNAAIIILKDNCLNSVLFPLKRILKIKVMFWSFKTILIYLDSSKLSKCKQQHFRKLFGPLNWLVWMVAHCLAHH